MPIPVLRGTQMKHNTILLLYVLILLFSAPNAQAMSLFSIEDDLFTFGSTPGGGYCASNITHNENALEPFTLLAFQAGHNYDLNVSRLNPKESCHDDSAEHIAGLHESATMLLFGAGLAGIGVFGRTLRRLN